MSGVIALVGAFLAFAIPIGVPLFAAGWRSFGIIVALGVVFFTFVTYDLSTPDGISQVLGPFILGLALFGFAAGTIAKFVMLLGRR